MTLWRPTRRDLITTAPAALAASTLPSTLAAAPSESVFNFSVVGDWGRDGGDYQRQVANAMLAIKRREGSKFVVSTGDNFYGTLIFGQGVNTASDRQWDTSFERIYDPELDLWYVTLGNHDYAGIVEAQIERTWRSDRWRMPYYYHQQLFQPAGLPAVHMFFIDSVAWIGSESKAWGLLGSKPNEKRREEQVEWLTGYLRTSPAPIKLVFGHHGIYSIGAHGGETEMMKLDDVLRRYNVTAYVNGHDHCMYHVSHRGMNYLCSGAGSEMLPDYKGGIVRGLGEDREAGCVLKGHCQGTWDPQPTFPVWHAFLAKQPGGPYDLKGGFAHFSLTPQAFSVKFYEGIERTDGSESPREAYSTVLRTFSATAGAPRLG